MCNPSGIPDSGWKVFRNGGILVDFGEFRGQVCKLKRLKGDSC